MSPYIQIFLWETNMDEQALRKNCHLILTSAFYLHKELLLHFNCLFGKAQLSAVSLAPTLHSSKRIVLFLKFIYFRCHTLSGLYWKDKRSSCFTYCKAFRTSYKWPNWLKIFSVHKFTFQFYHYNSITICSSR